MKHLISIVGSQILPIYYPIKEYTPEYIHLICSKETIFVAERIRNLCQNISQCVIYDPIQPYKIKDIYSICEALHNNFPEDEFIYNLTGGTKPMAFAAHTIAIQKQANIIYTTQENEILDMKTFETHPMQCILQLDEMIQLAGQKTHSYDLLEQINPQDIACAQSIVQFRETNTNYFTRYSKYVRERYKESNMIPFKDDFPHNTLFEQYESGGFKLTRNDAVILDLPYPDALMQFFEGRWWETLVTNAIYEWNCNSVYSNEIWTNVKFSTQETSSPQYQDKNEIDILVNLGTRMLFIECKSGNVKQSDVYKIAQVRNTYGGDISKSVLVSYYPLNPDILEKCRDSHIYVFAPSRRYNTLSNHLKGLGKFLSQVITKLNV